MATFLKKRRCLYFDILFSKFKKLPLQGKETIFPFQRDPSSNYFSWCTNIFHLYLFRVFFYSRIEIYSAQGIFLYILLYYIYILFCFQWLFMCIYVLLFQFLNHCMAFFGFSYYLNFQALKVLRTADYAPYVVFIAAPRFNDHLLRKTKDMNVSQDYRQEPVLRSYFKDIHLITTS